MNKLIIILCLLIGTAMAAHPITRIADQNGVMPILDSDKALLTNITNWEDASINATINTTTALNVTGSNVTIHNTALDPIHVADLSSDGVTKEELEDSLTNIVNATAANPLNVTATTDALTQLQANESLSWGINNSDANRFDVNLSTDDRSALENITVHNAPEDSLHVVNDASHVIYTNASDVSVSLAPVTHLNTSEVIVTSWEEALSATTDEVLVSVNQTGTSNNVDVAKFTNGTYGPLKINDTGYLETTTSAGTFTLTELPDTAGDDLADLGSTVDTDEDWINVSLGSLIMGTDGTDNFDTIGIGGQDASGDYQNATVDSEARIIVNSTLALTQTAVGTSSPATAKNITLDGAANTEIWVTLYVVGSNATTNGGLITIAPPTGDVIWQDLMGDVTDGNKTITLTGDPICRGPVGEDLNLTIPALDANVVSRGSVSYKRVPV